MLLDADAKSIKAEVVISKGSVELVRYTTELTDPETKTVEKSNIATIISIIFLLIILKM